MWIRILIISCLGYCCYGMLVKSWGTGMKINRLTWSINDIFKEAVELMTLGQIGVHPIEGFKEILNTSEGNIVQFETYNGWLEDLQLEINKPRSDLRRVVMTRAERYLHEKTEGFKDKSKESGQKRGRHQHEMIICLECIALSFKRLHYAYRVEMNSTEESNTDPILLWTAGTLQNSQVVTLPITFQMSIMVNHVNNEENTNSTAQISKKQCIILLEPLQLSPWLEWWPTLPTRIGRFTFLADHVGHWLEKHFINSTMSRLRSTLDGSVRKILHTRNICLEILLKDSDYAHE